MWDSPIPVLLGLDSLVAGLVVAPLLRSSSYRLATAALFGAADAAASLLGMLIAVPLHGLHVVAPGVPVLYGLYLLVGAVLAGRSLESAKAVGRASTLPVFGALAIALSVDNLVAGPGASVVAAGCSSAALMLLGLAVGGRVFDGLPGPRVGAWTGAGLVAMACLAVTT